MERCTQSTPDWSLSPSSISRITASISTWASVMSMSLTICSMVFASFGLAMMTSAFVRSSARILIFSADSWPSLLCASLRWVPARVAAAAVSRRST